MNGCRVEIKKGNGKSWTNAYADAMIELANADKRVVRLTAAMPDGTGVSKYEKVHPDRFFDTEICASHLTAMAAGMAKSGMRPFAAIYSTFIQGGVRSGLAGSRAQRRAGDFLHGTVPATSVTTGPFITASAIRHSCGRCRGWS